MTSGTSSTHTLDEDALWFGQDTPRCFGVISRPDRPTGRGIVICNSLGFEGASAYRALRHLADRLMAHGYTVLRFDYDGTGDSDGGEWEPGRLDALMASIDAAVGVLAKQEGVSEVYLLGIRLGATLACLYACDHPGIAGLVLWSPCEQGGTFVREILALSRLSASGRPAQLVTADWFPEDSLEVVGFEFCKTTVDELRDLNLVDRLHRPPAPAVLLLDREDMPPSARLLEALGALGCRVDHVVQTDWSGFLVEDEMKSVLPTKTLDQIADWFGRTEASDTLLEAARPDVSPTLVVEEPVRDHLLPPHLQGDPVVEWTARIGDLFAIVCEPTDRIHRRRLAVILVNTGSTNRAGPGRLYVTLARYWASLGFTSVRVDLLGAGDSRAPDPTAENQPNAAARAEEVTAVAAWARRTLDIDAVASLGICSGAFNSFRAAIDGGGIDIAVLINPLHFSFGADSTVTSGRSKALSSANNMLRGLTSVERFKLVMRQERSFMRTLGRSVRGLGYMAADRVRSAFRSVGVKLAEPTEMSRDLRRLADQRVAMLIVFASDEPGARYLKIFGGSALQALERDGLVRIVDVAGGDHIFSPPGARQRLVEIVTSYLEQQAPRRDPQVAPAGPDPQDEPREPFETTGVETT